jgi:hypothetical protein
MTVTRRSVLLASTAAPTAVSLLATPAARAAGAAAGASGRHTVALRDGWRFALVNPGGITDPTGAYADAAAPDYDDSAWREVAVPHDWSIEQTPTTANGTTSGTGFFPGGLGWSNAFAKSATALLPAFSGAREKDWVSVDWGRPRSFDRVEVSFTVDATHSLPAAVAVAVWDGGGWAPVEGAAVDWATASDSPTVVTFDAVRGSRLRLTLTSSRPGVAQGAVRISKLEAPAG